LGVGAGRGSTDKASISRFLVIVVHLLALAARIADGGTADARHRLCTATRQLVRMNPRGTQRRTPLHLAASADTSDVGRYLEGALRVGKERVAHTRLPSVGFRSSSRFLAVSLQVT